MSDLERAINKSRAAVKKRGATYKPATVTGSSAGAVDRARERALKDAYKQIEVQQRKEANRHKFSSRKDIETRARADQAAGKIKRGELQKTVERRWKAAQKRREKFESGQKAARIEARKQARENVRAKDAAQLGVGNITAMITFHISSDTRVVQMTFPGSRDTLREDARDALAEYMQSEDGHLGDVQFIGDAQ